MNILRTWIGSVAVVTVMSLPLVATATAGEQMVTRTVKVSDLDLAKSGDVQKLYDRVHAAADQVCRAEQQRDWRSTRMQAPMGWRERCVSAAVDGAVREIGNPSLAALHTRAPLF
jgi:UrcA family protein